MTASAKSQNTIIEKSSFFSGNFNSEKNSPDNKAEQRPSSYQRHGFDMNQISILSPSTNLVQPKLKINAPNDKYEQEADSMAERVVGNSLGKLQEKVDRPVSTGTTSKLIQRLSASLSPRLEDAVTVETEDEEETLIVQPLSNPKLINKASRVSKKRLEQNQHSGKSLGAEPQSFMESQFGVDFSNVRIHDDSESAELASSINARAFTFGKDIYFDRGEYNPETLDGKRTLAHELTHVIQQGTLLTSTTGQLGVQRLSGPGKRLRTGVAPWGAGGPVGDDFEVDTDAGSKVNGWVAYLIFPTNLTYWCHGHSLGSYSKHGYSVYSGSSMKQVITDEWNNIAPADTKPGDIAVWTNGFDHSAKFESPSISNGTLDPNASMLSTKNGQAPLATMSLIDIIKIYGTAGVAVYRHK